MTDALSPRLSQRWLRHIGEFVFCLLAFFIPYQMEFYVPQLFGVTLTPVNVLGFVLLSLFLGGLLISSRVPVIPYWSWWLCFLILASAAYAFGPRIVGPFQGVWVVFRLALVPLLFYVGAVMFLTLPVIRRVIKLLAISAGVAGLIAVVQMLSGGQILGGYITNQRYLGVLQPLPPEVLAGYSNSLVTNLYLAGTTIYRGHGTFYTSNGFGAFISAATCLSWGLMRGTTGKRRWFWLMVFVAQVMGSIASFSRSSWAALVAGVGVAVLVEVILLGGKRPISRIIRFVPVFLMLIILVYVIASHSEKMIDHFITIFTPTKVSEFQWRQIVWKTALEGITAHPWIGSGTDSAFTVTDWSGRMTSYSAHNLFIGIAYELGSLNLIIFLFFAVNSFRAAWYSSKYATLISDRMLAVGLLATCVSFMVAGVGSALMCIENMAVLFWLLVGLAVRLQRETIQYYGNVVKER